MVFLNVLDNSPPTKVKSKLHHNTHLPTVIFTQYEDHFKYMLMEFLFKNLIQNKLNFNVVDRLIINIAVFSH